MDWGGRSIRVTTLVWHDIIHSLCISDLRHSLTQNKRAVADGRLDRSILASGCRTLPRHFLNSQGREKHAVQVSTDFASQALPGQEVQCLGFWFSSFLAGHVDSWWEFEGLFFIGWKASQVQGGPKHTTCFASTGPCFCWIGSAARCYCNLWCLPDSWMTLYTFSVVVRCRKSRAFFLLRFFSLIKIENRKGFVVQWALIRSWRPFMCGNKRRLTCLSSTVSLRSLCLFWQSQWLQVRFAVNN